MGWGSSGNCGHREGTDRKGSGNSRGQEGCSEETKFEMHLEEEPRFIRQLAVMEGDEGQQPGGQALPRGPARGCKSSLGAEESGQRGQVTEG